jgi:hypothetical protein
VARKYARDNRGRFASVGATGRGGRLKTASGKKRATQTMKASGGQRAGAIRGKVKRDPAAAGKIGKAKPNAATAATERILRRTAIKRRLMSDRNSIIPANPKSPKTIKAARANSTVNKPRTKGNTKAQVMSRLERKDRANKARLTQIVRAERQGARQGNQYERAIKRDMLYGRAKKFLQTGKLPGRDNSIAAQRESRQALDRLKAKNASRAKARALAYYKSRKRR